ncbi:MAG TPA: NAD(P)H-dependent oxidoreductase [Methylomusa anaerophila]|uniref:NADPH-dependent FMN reductase n=1 Tax=Methylomusa anaerophila TaxID=1930071 RepID=A0A348ALK0_9FIRM|nr:NAD(P)H-dependent oxidoreductase [Methylomusa anaerophila]BBB91948.1 NADPH-dependent FMN reductase [Methylomusa anaerophila]HML88040.1 NAD(P)H-dependent oxidoreductase [Methylomusa anaerophila]
MKICILMGSPRLEGNTAALLKPFINELSLLGATVDYIPLFNKNLKECIECFSCQRVLDSPGCIIEDDMKEIYASVLSADCLVFATPIFTWFCTPGMKAVLDRLFSCSKKYSGRTEKPLLLEGKGIALLTTCGAEISEGSDLMETALKRLAEYAHLLFKGHFSLRDINGISDFTSAAAITAAKKFAHRILGQEAETRG